MNADRFVRGGGSTFSLGKGRESAMTASSGLKGAVVIVLSLAAKIPSASIICVRVWRGIIAIEGRGKN